ncbi:MAG TPA: YitT family protein, partial [Methanocorpusculum sp.]|nr:YitT family protein [Methanocorpusculum sp.]
MITASPKSILKRTILLCIALGVMALGVALSIKADLGTSPISSVPYVVSLISAMSVGTATIL